MNASDIQTIFLLERYISPEYFNELLKSWQEFVTINESSLDRYMRNLPADARDRALPQQADLTWGSTVLPNVRNTLEALEGGYRQILSGDLSGLATAAGPVSDNRGIVDFSVDWMSNDELARFESLLARASILAFNIDRTEGAYWTPGSLSWDYHSGSRGPLNLPDSLPRYEIVNEPGVRTGDRVPLAGIYVADVPHSSPQFLNTRFEAPDAEVLLSYQTVTSSVDGSACGSNPVTEQVKCIWRRLSRLSDAGFVADTRQPNERAR